MSYRVLPTQYRAPGPAFKVSVRMRALFVFLLDMEEPWLRKSFLVRQARSPHACNADLSEKRNAEGIL
jgi:hypothetical protein